MTIERRSAPIMTLSLACSNSPIATERLPRRAAISAASLTRLARSAPEKPGVPRAMILASTSEASGTLRMWTLRIFSRPTTSGFGTTTWRSKRPGRSNAGSSTSGRLVAAIRITPFIGLEPVHLDQQLVQGLLALVIAAAEAGAAMPADRVDLVDEDDAGRVFLALLEHVAHPAGADADEHLDKVGARDREERHVGFAGDGPRQQGLAGARRPDQQHALGDLAAEALKFLRVLEVLDDLLELLLGLVDPGDVLKGDAPDLLGQKPRPALAKAHRPAAAALHLTHEKDPHADQEQHREPRNQHAEQGGHVVVDRSGRNPHALVDELGDEARVVRRVGRERPAVGEMTVDRIALNGHVRDLAAIDVVEKVGKGQGRLRPAVGRGLKQIEKRDEKQPDHDPEGEILAEIVHNKRLSLPSRAARARQAYAERSRSATIFAMV